MHLDPTNILFDFDLALRNGIFFNKTLLFQAIVFVSPAPNNIKQNQQLFPLKLPSNNGPVVH
jgi:hypothetical protein